MAVKSQGSAVGLREFAALIGRSLDYITAATDEGMPVEVRGGKGKQWRIMTAPAIKWLMEREARRVGEKMGDGRGLTIDDHKKRKAAADAAMAELTLAERKGELVDVAEVRRGWEHIAATVKARMLNIPDALAPEIALHTDIAQCQKLLTDRIRSALDELSRGEKPEEVNNDRADAA